MARPAPSRARGRRSSGSSRPRAPSAAALPRQADHDGARRRRQGDPDADRGPARPGVRRRHARRELADAGTVDDRRRRAGDDHRQLRRQAAALSRAARSASSRSTAPSTTSPWPARGRSRLTLSLILEEGLDAEVLRAEVEAIAARRAARPASRSSPATRRSSSADTADGMYICTTGIGASTPRATLSPAALRPGRPDPALGDDRRARHGDHARPRRVRARRRDPVRHPLACGRPSTRCSTRRAPTLRCLRDATRGGVASVLNELARASGVAIIVREARRAGQPGGRGAWSSSGSTRCTWPTRASSSPSSRPRRPTRRWPRCARCPAAKRRPRSARSGREPPGMVLVETSFGGRRVMDQLVGDPLPRIC